MPISGTARLDAGAHDWPHRHAAATRTIRQATDTTTLTSCPPPPTGPWSWPAAVDYSTYTSAAAILACLTRASSAEAAACEGCGVRLFASAARQHLATKHCYQHVAQQAERPAQSGSSTSAPFWAALLQLCHTAAAVPVWYYTPRMHACSLLCRPHADRHSLDGLVRTLPGLSRAFLALLASPTAPPPLLAAPLAAVGQRESWAYICPSAIPDLPFLQAEWR